MSASNADLLQRVVANPILFQKSSKQLSQGASATAMVKNGSAGAQRPSIGAPASAPNKDATVESPSGEELQLPHASKHLTNLSVLPILAWQRPAGPARGLENLGNTCFMNSTLQCLAATPAFTQYLAGKGHSATCNTSEEMCCISCYMEKFIGTHIHNASKGSAATPTFLARNIKVLGKQFRVGRQEDSHEFLRCLLHRMHREFLHTAGVKEGLPSRLDEMDDIHRLFGGYFRNQVHCTRCEFDSNSYESFLDLCLEVGNGSSSVEKALRHFVSKETLDEQNKWKCPRCKAGVRAVKQMTIRVPPPVLTIQLKRFSFTRPAAPQGKKVSSRAMFFAAFGGGNKLTDSIKFEQVLDLTPALSDAALREIGSDGKALYDLHGVLVHHGATPNSGHYFAYTRAPNGQWHCMNDNSRTAAAWPTVAQQQAYMLFYSRRPATVPPGVGLLPPAVLIGGKSERKGSAASESGAVAHAVSLPKPSTSTETAAVTPKAMPVGQGTGPQPTSVMDFEGLTWTPGAPSTVRPGTGLAHVGVPIPASVPHALATLSDEVYGMTKKGPLSALMTGVGTGTITGAGEKRKRQMSADDLSDNFAAEPVSPARAQAAAVLFEDDDDGDEDEAEGVEMDSDGAPEEMSANRQGGGVGGGGGGTIGIIHKLSPAEYLRRLGKTNNWTFWLNPDITSASCVPTFSPFAYVGLYSEAIRKDAAEARRLGLVQQRHVTFQSEDSDDDDDDEEDVGTRGRSTATTSASGTLSSLQLQLSAFSKSAGTGGADKVAVGTKRMRIDGVQGQNAEQPEFASRQAALAALVATATTKAPGLIGKSVSWRPPSPDHDFIDEEDNGDGEEGGEEEEEYVEEDDDEEEGTGEEVEGDDEGGGPERGDAQAHAKAAFSSFATAMSGFTGKKAPDEENSDSDSDMGGQWQGRASAALPAPHPKARRQLEQVQVHRKVSSGRGFDPTSLSLAPLPLSTSTGPGLAAQSGSAGAGAGFAGLGGWDDEAEDVTRFEPAAPMPPSHRPSSYSTGKTRREEEWDAILDTGRVKKVKDPTAGAGATTDLSGQFSAVLEGRVAKQSVLPGGKGYRKGHE